MHNLCAHSPIDNHSINQRDTILSWVKKQCLRLEDVYGSESESDSDAEGNAESDAEDDANGNADSIDTQGNL